MGLRHSIPYSVIYALKHTPNLNGWEIDKLKIIQVALNNF